MTLTNLILSKMEEDPDRVWTMDELISHLYPDPDREPENPEMIVRVCIHNIRGERVRVHTHRRRGYSLGREPRRGPSRRGKHLSPKALALLDILERRRGPITVDCLAGVLFPGRERHVAYSALRIYVARIRRVLGEDAIRTTPGGYSIGDRRRTVERAAHQSP